MLESTKLIAAINTSIPAKSAAADKKYTPHRDGSGAHINSGFTSLQFAKLVIVFAAPFLLSACGGAGQPSVESAFQSIQADITDVQTLRDMQGLTLVSEIPTGQAVYSGTVVGGFTQSSDGVTQWSGDIDVNANFDTFLLTGSIENIATNVAGFETPEGSIPLLGGAFDNGAGVLIYTLDGSGILTQEGNAAELNVAGYGSFVGDEAQTLSGAQRSALTWTSGENVGQTLRMYGLHILNLE